MMMIAMMMMMIAMMMMVRMMLLMLIKVLLISDEWLNVNVVLIQMIVMCNVMTIIFDVCDNAGNSDD